MTDRQIEIAAGWGGDRGVFTTALVKSGYLDGDECARAIHEWREHQPYVATWENRSSKAKIAASSRWKKAKIGTKNITKDNNDLTHSVMLRACYEHAKTEVEHARRNAPLPSPSPLPSPDPLPSPEVLSNAEIDESNLVKRNVVDKDICEAEKTKKAGCSSNSTSPKSSTRFSAEIQIVWQHYREHHQSCPGCLKSGRKEYRLIRDRLQDGFTTAQLMDAIDGYHVSPFHNGENNQGKKYLGLALIMRDISHVEAGVRYKEESGRPVVSEQFSRNARAIKNWLRKQNEKEKENDDKGKQRALCAGDF